ncbi:hypothetical protein LUZ60_002885 [Juncus effusus]|nr:hypothetical protein LUZ60_002885 [Juncus effusus]
MSVSPIGFEGYEKRLELAFSKAPIFFDPNRSGLRSLSRAQIDSFLSLARCEIVSSLSNEFFDSYVLSESSLFIFPHKMIIKTCGTTKLLDSIPQILSLAKELKLKAQSVKYSRGSFIFPEAQPAPHQSFAQEIRVLDKYFGHLTTNAFIVGDSKNPNKLWHIYHATKKVEKPCVTLEMCMTQLDPQKASVFFKEKERENARNNMTEKSGICEIIPQMEICDFEFEPCGYSMNGIHEKSFSTIHVTPEPGFSYASYEVMGFEIRAFELRDLVSRVLHCFKPAEFSLAVTVFGGIEGSWSKTVEIEGFGCKKVVEQELVGGGLLIYHDFGAKKEFSVSPRSILRCWNNSDEEEE